MTTIETLKACLDETFRRYDEGLLTQLESLNMVLSDVAIALYTHSNQVEDCLFKNTGKRPYELGL